MLTRKCPVNVNVAHAQATLRSAAATTKGCKHVVEVGNFDVLISAHCKTSCDRYAVLHNMQATCPSSPTLRVGPSPEQGGRRNDRRKVLACSCWPRPTSDCTALKQAFCLRRSLACDCGTDLSWRCLHCDSHVKVRLTETCGCSWARASRTPWITISGWSHRR